MIIEQRIVLKNDEVVDVLEVFDGDRREFFSYTYKIERRGEWRPCVRWDNWAGQPHIDRFDENGNLIEQKLSPERSLEEVLKIVKIFRRNLMSMDLTQL